MSRFAFAAALAGALIFALPAAGNAPPPPPTGVPADTFVLSLYQTKLESEAVSPEMGAAMTDSLILTHFTPDLLALYKAAVDASVNEPVIDGDVFWDAQDWDTKEVATKTTRETPTDATVEVDFKIAGEARKVTLLLKKFADGWQVDDIDSGQGSMRQWLSKAVGAAK